MSDKFDFDSSTLYKYIFIGILIVALAVLNIFFISKYINSNDALINDYALKDEDMNKVRNCAVAGVFYPADFYQLDKDLDGYLHTVAPELTKRPQILIVPHAGYIYSAKVAAKAYQKLVPFAKDIKKVVILGPSHHVYLKGAALSTADSFKTPLGKIAVDKATVNYLAGLKDFGYNNKAHKKEHSLEVQLPFLQKVLKKFKIVPIVYGDADPIYLAKILLPLLKDSKTLLVVSADLSHYENAITAEEIDKSTAQMVENGKAIDNHQSCGATGINTAVNIAKAEGMVPYLLDMAHSGEVNGDFDRVVGYASWMFTHKSEDTTHLSALEQEVENLQNFARHNKADLLKIADTALERAVMQKRYQPSREEYPNVLFDKGAAFVTLSIDGKLRGCIGSLIAHQAIALDVANNAFAAANEDNRFAPLTLDELKKVKVNISFLSSYEQIKFKNEADLLRQIKPKIDGLVLRDGDRQGLFLPSVWDELPDKKEFLNNLKIKAGLSPSYWSDNIKIFRFHTVEISE